MGKIQVTIVYLAQPNWLRFIVDVNDTSKVARLKRDILYYQGINVEQQLLVYWKQVLDDDQTLQSYGIGDHAEILLGEHVVLVMYRLPPLMNTNRCTVG
jgi:hypothetical protein